MFTFAIFIGIYSYLIFFLGIFGLLTKTNIWVISLVWLIFYSFYKRKTFLYLITGINERRINFLATSFRLNPQMKGEYLLVTLLILQTLVNLVGALGPELAFDSLWYHLTFPRLYLLHNAVYHIPGGLLYYSDMPKLGEMLYTGALSFGNEILAKVIHYSFGLFVSICLYFFSRKFFNRNISLLIVVIFYSNLVVDWESITAYIDLFRTFFEFLALWGIIRWSESQKFTWLAVSGIMMGLAITTKLLAIGSFFILLALIIILSVSKNINIKDILKRSFIFTFFTFLIPMPWFVFSSIHTGNPVFPFFTKTYEVSASSPNPLQLFTDLWNLFIHSADPISPIYLIFLPFVFVAYSEMKKEIKLIIMYSGFSLILWYFTPRTGGGRFILPYLPAYSIICGAVYSEVIKKTGREWKYISILLLFSIVFVAMVSIGYRIIANKRYIPFIIGRETKKQFLSDNLNFHFGDFYDIDNYFTTHIKSTDIVLLYGFHNLYYVNFPFVDSSWVKKGEAFSYIATQNAKLPSKYQNWQLVYANDKTMVQLYKPPKEECKKICRY
jgi:hypothetical protein